MSDREQKIWEAISSMMDGKPSLEEQGLINSWIKEDERNQDFLKIIRKRTDEGIYFSDEVKEKIYSKIESNVIPLENNRRNNYRIFSIAASIAVLFAFILLSLIFKTQSQGEIAYLEATTPFGAKTKFVLPDSTVVNLNSGSSLKYPAKFVGEKREVYLSGEAYFEVKKDPKHPFIVNTSNIDVKVLGTHFNMKSFPEEDVFETTVLEGSVALHSHSHQQSELVRLKPDQKAVYTSKNDEVKIQKINALLEASWKENKFYFDNETLTSIVNELERNYNVPIKICSKELNNETFSGFFDKNRTLYQVLDIMKFNRDFFYETKLDTIRIYLKDI